MSPAQTTPISPTTSPTSVSTQVSSVIAEPVVTIDPPNTTHPNQNSPLSAQPVEAMPAPMPAPTPSSRAVPSNASSGSFLESVLEALLEDGSVTQEQYDSIILENVNTGRPAEQILEEKHLVSEEALSKARSKVYNVPFVALREVGSSPEALSAIRDTVAKRYVIFPFALNRQTNTLSVAMKNPLDLGVIDFLEKKTGYRIAPHFTTLTELNQEIIERYAQSLSSEVTAALKENSPESFMKGVEIKAATARNVGDTIREAPIAKIVETILGYAVKSRASDVHIEPQEDKTRVRYRIDGVLHEKLVLPKSVQDAVVSRIKVLSDMKIDEKRIPQDGRFNFKVDKEEVDLRVSSLPTVHGEKIVMRLLKKSGGVPTLQELGIRGTALKNLEAAAIVPHGIVLVTGPTGSGKTTTLYSLLTKINSPKVNIVTLEDPVEYQMSGINQVQINPQAGLTFASGLRSFLRQDPNIIMVGEIRDQETAELAIQAALTGHVVFSTLHTNSAAGALPRLLDMKAEPFLLVSSMTLVMAQRVVRKICPNCIEEYAPEQVVIDDMNKVLGGLFDGWAKQNSVDAGNIKLHRGKGCDTCGGTGYKGRVGIFEVLVMNEKIGRLVLERKPAEDIERQGIEDGMVFMKQDGYLKVLEGITTIEEVLRVAEI